MKWHEKVVNAETVKAAKRIVDACGEAFYLAGGTALALQYGHRVSLDLDCFSISNQLLGAERDLIIERLQASGPLDVRTSEDRTCHFIVGKTFVSLFHYPYPMLFSHLEQHWQGLPVAHEEDICGMKLSAILGRGSKKDFVDLYILTKKLGLKRVFSIGKKKFPQSGNFILQVAKALVYFGDADAEPMPKMLAKIKWNEIKSYFAEEVPKHIHTLV